MRYFLSLIFLFAMISCSQQSACDNDIGQRIFYDGISTISSEPSYLIATITNENNGQTKEICFDANDLINGIQQEYPKRSYWRLKKERPCNHHFNFKDSATLNNLGFYQYNSRIVDSLLIHFPQSELAVLKQQIVKKDFKRLRLYTSAYPLYFEHFLIKSNIACYRDDESGYTVAYLAE